MYFVPYSAKIEMTVFLVYQSIPVLLKLLMRFTGEA